MMLQWLIYQRAAKVLKVYPIWQKTLSVNGLKTRALDKESDITEGELSDMISAAIEKAKEKYSGITEGEMKDMIDVAIQKTKEKYSGITAGQLNDMVNCGIDALKKAGKQNLLSDLLEIREEVGS